MVDIGNFLQTAGRNVAGLIPGVSGIPGDIYGMLQDSQQQQPQISPAQMLQQQQASAPSPVVAPATPAVDPYAAISSAITPMNMGPGPSAYQQYQQISQAFDPTKMAQQQYGPQYAMLDKLSQDEKNRYTYSSGQVGGMYQALQNSINGDAATTGARYNQSGKDIAANYAATQATQNGALDAEKTKTADMLKTLGIQASGNDVYGKLDQNSNMWTNAMAANNQTAMNANNENKQSALDYNTTMGQRAGFEGKGQQAGLMGQLIGQLNANDQKRFETQSAQGASQAGYTMDQIGMYKNMMDSQALALNNQYKNQIAQARVAVQQGRLGETAQQNAISNAAAQQKTLDPYSALMQGAGQYSNLWGTPQIQQGMGNLVANQFSGGNWQQPAGSSATANEQAFLQHLAAASPHLSTGSQNAEAQLGTKYFNAMYKGKV